MNHSSLNRLHIAFICSLLILLLFWTPVSDGRDFRPVKLPDRGVNWGCATCHINRFGGGARNAFGRDYEAIALRAGDVYTAELGQTDSDGDGFSNDDEFNANPPTEPWNPDSHPPVEPRAVEPNGKTFTVWARLKSLPAGASLNFRSTPKSTFLELTKVLKGNARSVHQVNSVVIESNRSAAKIQPPPLSKFSAKKIEEIQKSVTKSRTPSKR